MPKIEIYTSALCGYCSAAKRLLERKGANFQEIRVDQEAGKRDEMVQRSGRMTVPQIFIGETHVGGYDDMAALDRAGGLDPLLAGEA
ncbi:MAG: glutaredoxin 3 [Xanthomonadales bacterium]|nr:glutaredoxin 3 [Xanthomonadales bacterium]MCB1627014.1 glutaredoxin 3 [Xanthomonadales bacterium]MCB1635681.1 glutaredoxin 3 [Xanthomonadales bacterium]MCB1640916.1 glutaredoxin 3 [Xanthomonadales bacterium]